MLDFFFYKKAYPELENMSEIELFDHWNKFGSKEGRLPSLIDFQNKYPGFDLIQYKNTKLNSSEKISTDEQYMAFFHHKTIKKDSKLDPVLKKIFKDLKKNKINTPKPININNTDYFGIKTFFPLYYKNINGLNHINNIDATKHFKTRSVENMEYIYKNFNYFYYYDNKHNKSNPLNYNICDLYDDYCGYGYSNKKICNIINYNLIDSTHPNYLDSNELFMFIKTFCLDQLMDKYFVEYETKTDIIPLFYNCENDFAKNFLIEYNLNETLTKNYDYVHFTLDLIFYELKKNNIKWKYLVYTNEPIIITHVLLIHNIFIIYKIIPVQTTNIIFTNLTNTDPNNDIWITTHQQLFLENIYKKKINYLDMNNDFNNDFNNDNTAYVLTINDKRYDYFLTNSNNKKINMNYIKVNGINKKSLNNKKYPNINLGHLACSIGHYLILKKYFNADNPKNILIMEDDNDFNSNFNDRWRTIKKYLNENLDKWEIFNGNCCVTIYPYDLTIVNDEKIIKYTNNTKTNFIYYNQKSIPKIIDYYNTFYFNLIHNNNASWIIDRFFRALICITTIPFLTNEIPESFSNIDNIVQKYFEMCKHVENDINKILDIIM